MLVIAVATEMPGLISLGLDYDASLQPSLWRGGGMLLTGLGHLGPPLGLGTGASPIPNAGLCHGEDQSSLKGKSGSFKQEKHGRGWMLVKH